MRVLLVVNTLPPDDISGVGEQVLQLAAGLRGRGHEVEILGRGRGQARGPKLLFPLTVVAPFVRALRRFRPHVVQVHESDGALAALVTAVLAATSRPRPLLVALLQVSYVEEFRAVRALRHEGRVMGRPGWVELRFKWLKAPLQVALGWLSAWLADVVMAPSRQTAGELERDYGVDPVGVLANVTGSVGAVADPTPDDRGYLLFVGRLRIRKGVEVLLEALALLGRTSGTRPRLLVAGDGEHLDRLRRTRDRLGLEERVEFLGRCPPSRVRSLMAGATALVVPSIYEGMPLVILEAMEAGLAVVASRVSGIPEVVIDGETGWLVPAESPPALAAALSEALEGDRAARRGAAGAARAAAGFTADNAAESWEQAVAAGRRRNGGDVSHG